MRHTPRPSEPPLTGYTRRTTDRSIRFPIEAVVPAATVLLIALVAVFVVWQDTPAQGAADHAAVVAKPTAQPGAKPVEHAPPLAAAISDGTWLLGKEIKRGIYASTGGRYCYWERLADLSGSPKALLQNGYARPGQQRVALGMDTFAFTSANCGRWELVR